MLACDWNGHSYSASTTRAAEGLVDFSIVRARPERSFERAYLGKGRTHSYCSGAKSVAGDDVSEVGCSTSIPYRVKSSMLNVSIR
jgi:hypothetical protein